MKPVKGIHHVYIRDAKWTERMIIAIPFGFIGLLSVAGYYFLGKMPAFIKAISIITQ